MDKLKSDYLTHKEVIDGVTVVYTGRKILRDDKTNESVKMYDSNGNRFYCNYESIEEANKAIAELAERGITAVVGPKAPCRAKDGHMIPNSFENLVGVFVVSVPEKSDDFPSPKTR